ncbi:MAG: aminopeptidase P family protein [Nevskia sp.]|nr:aminopeptidase P family protein [Nevskia sp.]
MPSEADRVAALLDAQRQAAALFVRIEQSLIRPGISESQLTREIAELGRSEFGIVQNWHKRIVRAGPNTLEPYDENPPDLTIGADDILFVDLGPVFEAWEADFGRSYVLGNDPHKLRLRDDVAAAFAAGKKYFQDHPHITGSELYAYVHQLAQDAGWEFGGKLAAHMIGEFPHKSLPVDRAVAWADAGNHTPMRGLDPLGRERHWILEIHFVDRLRRIGAFYEELLTVG